MVARVGAVPAFVIGPPRRSVWCRGGAPHSARDCHVASLLAMTGAQRRASAVGQPVLDEAAGDAVDPRKREAVLLAVAHLVAGEPAGVLEFLGVDGDLVV